MARLQLPRTSRQELRSFRFGPCEKTAGFLSHWKQIPAKLYRRYRVLHFDVAAPATRRDLGCFNGEKQGMSARRRYFAKRGRDTVVLAAATMDVPRRRGLLLW